MDNKTIYKNWFYSHGKKHAAIMKKISHLDSDAIIKYFDFENMVKNEPNFCPLYKEHKKCHNIDFLNCYLCACPLFCVEDTKSYCSINAKEGSSIKALDGYIHQDCSKCTIPHTNHFVLQNFNKDWLKAMKEPLI